MPDLSGCTIAFDLDGTLADTAPDIHRALNHIMADIGLPAASEADVRAMVGQGSRALIIRASAVHGIIHDETKLDALVEEFFRIYGADIARDSRPWPGVEPALAELQAAGATLCVCTNKATALSNQLLAALGLSHWFAAVVGGDSVERRKPHPEHLIAAIRAAHGDPTRALMVGDSIFDVGSARGAGAPVILYAYGYTDTAPALLGADAVFTQFNEVMGLAARLLGAQPMPRV